MSTRYRDQPMTPAQTGVYWVEYVVRHKGAPHLHSAGQDLGLIAYHNIDVFIFIFFVLYLIYYGISRLLGVIFRSKPNVSGSKKNN